MVFLVRLAWEPSLELLDVTDSEIDDVFAKLLVVLPAPPGRERLRLNLRRPLA